MALRLVLVVAAVSLPAALIGCGRIGYDQLETVTRGSIDGAIDGPADDAADSGPDARRPVVQNAAFALSMLDMAAADDGQSFALLWSGFEASSDVLNLYSARIDLSGSFMDGPTNLGPPPGLDPGPSRLLSNANGWVHFTHYLDAGGTGSLFSSTLAPQGTLIEEREYSGSTHYGNREPARRGDEFTVFFHGSFTQSDATSRRTVRYRTFDGEGKRSGPATVLDATVGRQTLSSACAFGNRTFILFLRPDSTETRLGTTRPDGSVEGVNVISGMYRGGGYGECHATSEDDVYTVTRIRDTFTMSHTSAAGVAQWAPALQVVDPGNRVESLNGEAGAGPGAIYLAWQSDADTALPHVRVAEIQDSGGGAVLGPVHRFGVGAGAPQIAVNATHVAVAYLVERNGTRELEVQVFAR